MQPPADAITYEHATVEVAADPDTVYALVSDIGRMGEWSPEAVGGDWLDGGTGQAGDRFEGHNRSGEREWTRECVVARAEPGQDFTFVVGSVEANCTWWSYEMEPSTTGTKLTERWWMVNKTPAMQAVTPKQLAGRVELWKTMLRDTISSVKATAEAQ